ncbi:MAG TPA: tryptophan synthase subunit alpha [Acidimicrobiales bacterium]|jgi:tryptophan synthase alpha chain|nr:tryptophan synthase subunit alpha [Acidimicrobiales bacterium]
MTAVGQQGRIETALRASRDGGRKLLVPYVTGGLGDDWIRVVEAVAAAGADAIEIGIPFSDPVMDGPVIQEASQRALAGGATPVSILADLARIDAGVPLVVMSYYNILFRAGHLRFARSLAAQGVSGAIVPDLPLVELDGWAEAADAAGVETILLAAPNTPDVTLAEICRRSRGWVYGVALMGVTGERSALASSAGLMGRRLKAITDTPVLIGVGVSSAAQAVEAAADADGVIVGSALVRRLLEGAGPDGAAAFVAELRAGLDGSGRRT